MANYHKEKGSCLAVGNGVHSDGQLQNNVGSMMYQENKRTSHPANMGQMDVRRLYEEITSLKSEFALIKKKVPSETKLESYTAAKGNTKTETVLANTRPLQLDFTAAVPKVGGTRQTDNASQGHEAIPTGVGLHLKGPDGIPRAQDSVLAGEEEGFPPANPARQTRGGKFKTRLRKGPADRHLQCKVSPKLPLTNHSQQPEKRDLPSRINNVTLHERIRPTTSEQQTRRNNNNKLPTPAKIIPKIAAIPNKVEEGSSSNASNIRKLKLPKHQDQKKYQRYSTIDDKPLILTKPRKRSEKKPAIKKEDKALRLPDFTPMSLPCQNGLICPPRGRKGVAPVPYAGVKAYEKVEP